MKSSQVATILLMLPGELLCSASLFAAMGKNWAVAAMLGIPGVAVLYMGIAYCHYVGDY